MPRGKQQPKKSSRNKRRNFRAPKRSWAPKSSRSAPSKKNWRQKKKFRNWRHRNASDPLAREFAGLDDRSRQGKKGQEILQKFLVRASPAQEEFRSVAVGKHESIVNRVSTITLTYADLVKDYKLELMNAENDEYIDKLVLLGTYKKKSLPKKEVQRLLEAGCYCYE